MGRESVARHLDILEALRERILVYLEKPEYTEQAFTVLVYSLEYLVKCKRLVHTGQEKTQFLQAQHQTRQLIQRLRSSNLSAIKKASLVFMEVDPCFVFAVGIRFRGLLERFL